MAVGYLDWPGLIEYTTLRETMLRKAMRDGELPFIKFGEKGRNAVRFKVEDVDAYMERYRVAAKAG